MKKNAQFTSLKEGFLDSGITLIQVFFYLVYFVPCRLYYRAERNYLGTIQGIQRGSLIVANHVSTADPFIILSYVPFHIFLRMTPIYFPIDPDYFRKPLLHPWLFLLGGYDAGRTRKEKFLMILRTRSLLRRKKTVLLFPEGRISTAQISEFEHGIEYFAREARSVALVKILASPVRRNITFLGVKTFTEHSDIFAKELRDVFLSAQ